MYRIGLIGTENSHALAFSRYFNLPKEDGSYNQPEFRVVGIYGPDPDSTKVIMDEVGVEFIAQSTDEFIGKVDCVMITCRKGSLHHDHAVKFAKLGMPLFVDKPLTNDVELAKDLIAVAAEYGVPLVGGSSVKYSPDVPELKEKIEKGLAEGTLSSAVIHYAADRTSEYDGFWFYASHAVETMFALFGDAPRSVVATTAGPNITAVVKYDNTNVTLQYNPECYACGVLLVGKGYAEHRMLSFDGIFEAEAMHFAEMVKTGVPNQTPEELVKPVVVMDAIVKSYESGKEIEIRF